LKEHHHNGDALLGTQVVVLGRHGNTLHEVLHLLLETAIPLWRTSCSVDPDYFARLSATDGFRHVDFADDAQL
jgi:hypothetical protein